MDISGYKRRGTVIGQLQHGKPINSDGYEMVFEVEVIRTNPGSASIFHVQLDICHMTRYRLLLNGDITALIITLRKAEEHFDNELKRLKQ